MALPANTAHWLRFHLSPSTLHHNRRLVMSRAEHQVVNSCAHLDGLSRLRRRGKALTGKTLADDLDDGVVLDVVGVVGLQLGRNAGQGSLEGLLGGGIDHLGLFCGSTLAMWLSSGSRTVYAPEHRHHRETRR